MIGNCFTNPLTPALTPNKWTQPSVSGTPPSGRLNHSAVLYNNLMYIFAGL